MAKMTAADITAITAQVEEIEKNGGEALRSVVLPPGNPSHG